MFQFSKPSRPLHHVLQVGEAGDGGAPGDVVGLLGEVLCHLESGGILEKISSSKVESIIQELSSVDSEIKNLNYLSK